MQNYNKDDYIGVKNF